MTKCLFCSVCGALKSFALDGSVTRCDCPRGQVVGWWVDHTTALVQMAVLPPGTRDQASVVLIHNGFLRAARDTIPSNYIGTDGRATAYPAGEMDALWRQIHAEATITPPRPESLTVFDRSRRACPMVIQDPGISADTHWATDADLRNRGLLQPAPV